MSKGEQTRDRIVDRAFHLGARDGIEGVTIGALASETGLSKSGLFAHFGSKEELQIAVLEFAAKRFEERVFVPAFEAARGLPRLQRIFELWLHWSDDVTGGCFFYQAVPELDDTPGPVRDQLQGQQAMLLDALAQAVKLCVLERHFRADVDPRQFAFEMEGIVLAFRLAAGLLKDRKAQSRARTAFTRLVDSARR